MPLIRATNELVVRILNAYGGFAIHGFQCIQWISMAGLSQKLTAIVELITAVNLPDLLVATKGV